MKTKIVALLMSTLFLFNSSFANDGDKNVKESVLSAFSQQFEKATEINWIQTSGYYKATFTWNAQILSAFYSESGEAIAVTRNILPGDLPLVLQIDLDKEYKNYWITELFEYNSSGNSKYYLTVENADKKIIVESIDKSYWSVFRKTAKA